MEAPRWRLINAHYLPVATLPDGTDVEYQQSETNRESGRVNRKTFQVPMFLNPGDSADQNYPGEIIVTHEVEGAHNERRDYIFTGEPTPEMEPLNEAAEAISDSLRAKWTHPIDSLAPNGQMSDAESAFMTKMMEAFGKVTTPTSVPKADYDALQARLAALEAALLAKPVEAPARRV